MLILVPPLILPMFTVQWLMTCAAPFCAQTAAGVVLGVLHDARDLFIIAGGDVAKLRDAGEDSQQLFNGVVADKGSQTAVRRRTGGAQLQPAAALLTDLTVEITGGLGNETGVAADGAASRPTTSYPRSR